VNAAPRRLGAPRRAIVSPGPDGAPLEVNGARIEAVREEWLVEDRWWTDRSLRRRYFEVVDERGRDVVVFHDLERGRWFEQRA